MRRDSLGRALLAGSGLALASSAAGVTSSHANGRAPALVSVGFQPGANDLVIVPATFGLLISKDGGQTFKWVCESTVGYSGIFDPDYAVSASGDIYATTFDGVQVSRDGGCTFERIGRPVGSETFTGEVEVGPDGRVWAATSAGEGMNDVFVSEDGATFVSSNLADDPKAWWLSVRTTPADPRRIYVSGYLPREGPLDAGTSAEALLRRSDDGGATWQDLPVDGFAFRGDPRLYLLGVSPMNADVLFARVVDAIAPNGDVLYRSDDGGASWVAEVEFADKLVSFVIRADGMTVIAGTINACPGDADAASKGCVQISHDGGVTWGPAREQPRLACLGERSDGTLFGCGANWVPDNFALGRSQDGETWEKVYRFVETAGPLECPSGTNQSQCAALVWPGLCAMFGICESPDAGATGDDGGGDGGDGGGCCKVGGSTDASWIPALLFVLSVLAWRGRARNRPRGRAKPG